MYSFSLENLTLPFELTKEESELLAALKTTLATTAEVSPEKQKELVISSVKNFPPEQMIKFLLVDPSLLPIAEYQELKEYWRGYVENHWFIYNDITFIIQNEKPKEHLSAYKIQIREDLSMAQQAIALYCLIQDKNYHSIPEQTKHQWTMLAIKYGSDHAAIRAKRRAHYALYHSDKLLPHDPEKLTIINDALNILINMAEIHGASGLYCLAYFCTFAWQFLLEQNKYSALLSCAYQAFCLAQQIFTLPYCQISLNNLTFGKPQELLQRNFKTFDLAEQIKNIQSTLGEKRVLEIEGKVSNITTLFSSPVTHVTATEFRTQLNVPKLEY